MTARRRALSRLARVRIFDRASGMCEICGLRISAGQKWEAHHSRQLWLGGEDTEANMVPVHVSCHKQLSAADNTPRAKSDRVRANHLGVRKRRTIRAWRKFDGSIVRADD